MGAKALLIHPSYQGVCGWHGVEDLCVTLGGLSMFLSGIRISGSISREVKCEAMRAEESDGRIVPQAP